jgi:hypothetical protein
VRDSDVVFGVLTHIDARSRASATMPRYLTNPPAA